jgi:activating signal cointegrator complex subunit 2
MLERMPEAQRQRKLEKHEFRGNQAPVPMGNSALGASGRGGGSFNGRGQGGSRGGRGRGGRGSSSGGANGGAGRGGGDRAWKDKNKAHQANHNRKRGHDKKMKLAGAGA